MPFPNFYQSLNPVNTVPKRCPSSRENASHRILIAKYGALGDVLMATPLLAELRHAFPNAHITWLVKDVHREAIDANPHLDEVISGDGNYWRNLLSQRWKKWLDIPQRWLGLRWVVNAATMLYQLRRRKYDMFFALSADEWPLLALAVNAPTSIGIEEWEHNPHSRFYTQCYTGKALAAHRTSKYFTVLEALKLPIPASKQMVLGYTAEDAAVASGLFEKHKLSPFSRVVIIAPQTTWSSKNWTLERYAAVADKLSREQNCQILFTGTRKDEIPIQQIRSAMKEPSISTAGLLSIRQLAAVIDRASLVISGDTGPMHIAGALGTPFVALFGSTDPAFYAPTSGLRQILMHPVPCGPCDKMVCKNQGDQYLACMHLISVSEVYDAARLLLAKSAPSTNLVAI